MQEYYDDLLLSLPSWAVRYDLGIVATEALTVLVSTGTVIPSQNIIQVTETLRSGYLDLWKTMSSLPLPEVFDALMLESFNNVGSAYWLETQSGQKRLVVRLRMV